MDEYVLTDAQFRSLARGTGTADAIALLVDSQASRHRLLLLAAAERAAVLPPVLRDGLALIAHVDRQSPDAVRQLLRHPFLGAWFARLVAPNDDHCVLESAGYLGALAVAAAVLGGVPCALTLPSHAGDLVLPALGTVVGLGAGPVKLRFDGTDLEVAGADTTFTVTAPFFVGTSSWRPARRVRPSAGPPSILLTIEDSDPLRDRYSAPARQPLAPSEADEFSERLVDAWRLLVTEQPESATGLSIGLRAIVPLAAPADGTQVSASARDSFGAIGMSVSDDPVVVAELLVHEFQHEKLGALLDLVELCRPGGSARHHAPWRADPRPAAALMQGVYAFAAVAGFWRSRRLHLDDVAGRHAQFQFAYWREQVAFAVDRLLGSGELTELGLLFCTELSGTLDTWRSEPVATGASEAAWLSAVATRARWRLANQQPTPEDVGALAAAWQGDQEAPAISEPTIVGGRVPETGLPGLLEAAWVSGGAAPTTQAEQAIVAGAYAKAAEMLTAALIAQDRAADWIALAVALVAGRDPGKASADQRPELLRAVFARLGEDGQAPPDPVALARWLTPP